MTVAYTLSIGANINDLGELERPVRTAAEKMRLSEPTTRNLNEGRPTLSAAEMQVSDSSPFALFLWKL